MAIEFTEEELTVVIRALEEHEQTRKRQGLPAEQAAKLIQHLKSHQGAAPAAPPVPPISAMYCLPSMANVIGGPMPCLNPVGSSKSTSPFSAEYAINRPSGAT